MLSAVLFHDMINVSESFVLAQRLAVRPYIWAAITIGAAAIVTFLWGSKTLARYRCQTLSVARGARRITLRSLSGSAYANSNRT